ncbi:hypothetical protein L1049_021746 [Liquidambar formosana]|uniref:Uncharacterized protein n=1 Tax=Liquidambar formosana TaxID=63359 RepID=A0AAP0RBC6_LIQFO
MIGCPPSRRCLLASLCSAVWWNLLAGDSGWAAIHGCSRSGFTKGKGDYQPMLELVGLLVRKFFLPSGIMKKEDHSSEVVDNVLQLMLCILDGLLCSNDMSAISEISLQWGPVFDLRNASLLNFIREMLLKDPCVLYTFRINILRVMNDLIETSQEEVVYLILSLCGRMQVKAQSSSILDGTSEERLSKIRWFLAGSYLPLDWGDK